MPERDEARETPQFTTDIVIGLEIHAELDTKTKLFCGCARTGSEEPNTRVCPVCLGHPGARPVPNAAAVEAIVKLGLALDCEIAPEVVFSRKSYFYPDMSKNYQTTQFELPVCAGGGITLTDGKGVGITRIHLEEDPASIVYPGSIESSEYVLLDYNRAGNPLVELVTEPELHSPAEAREFLNKYIQVLTYLDVFDPNTCIIKADANVSLKETGYTRVEIKNITGFKELERALTYEITRQRMLLRRNAELVQETRGWNAQTKTTRSLRTKETEADYGYITEPDIALIDLPETYVGKVQQRIPELAHQKAARYAEELGVEKTDAEVMASERPLAELFERVAAGTDPVLAARWLRRELLRVLNYNKKTLADIGFGADELIELIELVRAGTISETTGQKLMERLVEEPFSPKERVEEEGLQQVGDAEQLRGFAERVVSEHPEAVSDYREGEEKSFNFLVGQVMRLTRGKADPQKTREALLDVLDE